WAKDAAWACAIGPDALPDMTPVVGLARLPGKDDADMWSCHGTLGRVLYRTGAFEEAVKELETANRLHGKGGDPLDHLFLAVDPRFVGRGRHKCGRAAEAMQPLAAAEKLLDAAPAWFWSDKLERQFLRDEATKLIRGK